MTDYLEELLENTGALLEQVRRLERSGAVRGTDAAPGPASPADRPSGRPEEAPGTEPDSPAPGDRGTAGQSQPAPQAGPEPPRRVPTPLEAQEDEGTSPPLLKQLERLERAAARSAGGTAPAGAPARSGSYPLALSRPGAGDPALTGEDRWTRGAGLERPLPLPGGELRWAEQADRAFRRDSRRYDGGFYLY